MVSGHSPLAIVRHEFKDSSFCYSLISAGWRFTPYPDYVVDCTNRINAAPSGMTITVGQFLAPSNHCWLSFLGWRRTALICGASTPGPVIRYRKSRPCSIAAPTACGGKYRRADNRVNGKRRRRHGGGKFPARQRPPYQERRRADQQNLSLQYPLAIHQRIVSMQDRHL